MTPQSPAHLDDLRLAATIVGGSTDAWHDFVDRYSALIVSVVRRYMEGFEEDDQRNVYVDTLEHFFATGLAQYDGMASLSTWVITVTRSRSLDHVRARYGRRREPSWLQHLPERDRAVYRFYFVESRRHGEILAWFASQGQPLTPDELVEIVEGLDREIDPRVRIRLAYEFYARTVGAVSGRLLELLDSLRWDAEQRAEALRPDHQLLETQTRELLARLGEYVERLPEPERSVVEMHYFQDLPASRIAERLDLPNSRRAYTLVGRALHRLRGMIAAKPHGTNGHGRPTSSGTNGRAKTRRGKK